MRMGAGSLSLAPVLSRRYGYPVLTYDLRSQLTRPACVLVFALVAYGFYSGLMGGRLTPQIPASMDLPLLGSDRVLVSLGEWGRSLLLSLELFLGVPLSALVGFLAARPFADEVEHGAVLWPTSRAAWLPATKAFASTTIAWSCLVVGGGCAFLNPQVRAGLSLAGWQWVPLFFLLAWLRIAVWTAMSGLVFYLTKSRWASIGVLPAVQMLWFGLAGAGATGLVATVHRGLLAWGFPSLYAPLGVGVAHLAAQVSALVGTVAVLFGGGVRRD
jgi:hypothetical protein